jgi:hypothetical protein
MGDPSSVGSAESGLVEPGECASIEQVKARMFAATELMKDLRTGLDSATVVWTEP